MSLNQQFTDVIFLSIIIVIPAFGIWRGIKIYDEFIDGAKHGLQITFDIIPYLVAMLIAIGMFRASGALETIGQNLAPVLDAIGMPSEVLPLALIRPFSGSAANGVLLSLVQEYGGNSYIAKLAATMMGSTETTFYVVALYFGVVNITRTRHAIPVGLLADLAGVLAAVWICSVVFA